MNKSDVGHSVLVISVAGLLAGCAATEPPSLPQNNPTEPQVRSSSTTPRNLLVRDETTLAIEKQLSATEADAKNAESMHHDMNMSGMQHEGMKMEQHGQMKKKGEMTNHEGMQHGKEQPEEKKALEEEMKKTSDEMKATSDAMKQKSDQMKRESAALYTCPLHSQVQSDQPGRCPICGTTLVRKKAGQ